MIDPRFSQLWAALRGHGFLWHRTNLSSLESILCDQRIEPNVGQRTPTYGQSRVSYAWHLGAVSLFDFDTCSETDMFEHEWKWGTVLTKRVPAGVLIGIRREALDHEKLINPSQVLSDDLRLDALPKDVRKGRMVIPAVEALHIGPISTETVDRYILSARSDDDDFLMYELGYSSDLLDAFRTKSATWDAANARDTSENNSIWDFTGDV